MSSLLNEILGQLDPSALSQLGRQVGAKEEQIGGAVQAALPALLGALSKNANDDSGASALLGALDKDHDGSILDDLAGFMGNSNAQSQGAAILGHIFGRQEPAVAKNLAGQTQLSGQSMSQLLAMLAPIVMGTLGKRKRQQSMNSRSLSEMLGGERREIQRRQPGILDMLGGGLDSDGDGDVDGKDMARAGVGLLGRIFGRK